MPVSEILIVYFAFGAPVAVYRYLETNRVSTSRRALIAATTFFFWIPYAVRLALRRLNNASSDIDFVSTDRKNKFDSVAQKRSENVRSALLAAGCPLSPHDLRERIDRYVGLSVATKQDSPSGPGEKAISFFKAAGGSTEMAAMCLTRRENTRLYRHLDEARRSFLELFEQLSGSSPSETRAVRRGLELVLVLDDIDAADYLGEIERKPIQQPEVTLAGVVHPSPAIDVSATIRETRAHIP